MSIGLSRIRLTYNRGSPGRYIGRHRCVPLGIYCHVHCSCRPVYIDAIQYSPESHIYVR